MAISIASDARAQSELSNVSASAPLSDFHPNIRQETETDPLPEEILTLRLPGGITEIVPEKHWRRYQGLEGRVSID